MRLRRFLALAVAAALLAGACTSDDKEQQARPGISQQRAEQGALDLKIVAADLVSPHRRFGPLDGPTREAVTKALQQTFDATVVRSLTRGKGGSIQSVFTGDAAERAAVRDRAVLFDEGLPEAAQVVPEKLNVRLTGLHGADAKPALVVAKIDWDVHSDDGTVRVQRVGELSLIPVLGEWLVGAYSVVSTRTVAGETTTTTAAAG